MKQMLDVFVIGLSGPAKAGKDTVFSMIQECTKVPVVRDAFADRLKVSAARALGYRGDTEACIDFCNSLKDESVGITVARPGKLIASITGREYLQLYGTEAHREVFGTDFWVEQVIARPRPPRTITVVTDVRFPNEAQAIRSRYGKVWRINREAQIKETAHASEQPLPATLVDLEIDNTGTLEDLREEVIKACKRNLPASQRVEDMSWPTR
jgi:hypothetical protein